MQSIQYGELKFFLICPPFRLGLNHFQEMPTLPGSHGPLELLGGSASASGAKRKTGKGGKPKAKAERGVLPDDDPKTPKTKKRRGDDELLQVELKRQHFDATQCGN